jgi:radical SAM superfamily enzyme YgiQ (UPF0313 family)
MRPAFINLARIEGPKRMQDNKRSASFNILLIYPRFLALSFWNYKATCEVTGARYPAAPLGLITVAALLPDHWNLRLVNRNTEELTEEDIAWADLVMTGGMMAQQIDTLELIDLCQSRGKRVVIGGPDISSSPHVYEQADFLVIGESEEIMKDLVAAIERGDRNGRFEAEKFKTDVTTSPIPRFDLLKFSHYLHIGVQFSRGCPFTCEFCDIIELYGRVPRAKTNEQMLAELESLYQCGYRGHVDFVDDNMIGNKKALKLFLPKLASWLKERNYPFEFSTEASVNLADDNELLRMLRDANFFACFVGIETPDPETLIATSKKQNTRRDLSASIHKIYGAGLFVTAGFIVGFDGEKGSVAKLISSFIEQAAIPVCMVGLLYALPNTQLTRRLSKEGRLYPNHDVIISSDGDQCTLGLNFETQRPRNEILADCQSIVRTIYDPSAYFERVRRVGRALDCTNHKFAGSPAKGLRDTARILWSLGRNKHFAPQFFKMLVDCAIHNPRALPAVIKLSALYLHFGPFSQTVVGMLDQHIAAEVSQWQRLPTLRQKNLAAGHIPSLAAFHAQADMSP